MCIRDSCPSDRRVPSFVERVGRSTNEGTRRSEGQNINKSLLTLSTVISKLATGRATHIPYRDSKLTRLLSTSLGGNARTVLLVMISPAQKNREESMSTLKFGQRAKLVKNRAQVNKTKDDASLLNK